MCVCVVTRSIDTFEILEMYFVDRVVSNLGMGEFLL